MAGIAKSKPLLIGIGILVLATGVVAGNHFAVTQQDTEGVDLSNASVEQSALVVNDYNLMYDGTTVTDVDVTVENTDGTNDLTADITVNISHGGTDVSSGSASAVTVTAGTTQTVTVAVTDTDVTKVETIDIKVVET